ASWSGWLTVLLDDELKTCGMRNRTARRRRRYDVCARGRAWIRIATASTSRTVSAPASTSSKSDEETEDNHAERANLPTSTFPGASYKKHAAKHHAVKPGPPGLRRGVFCQHTGPGCRSFDGYISHQQRSGRKEVHRHWKETTGTLSRETRTRKG